MESLIKGISAFILILFIATVFIPKMAGKISNEYYTQNGETASAEGTVTGKHHTDAYYEYNWYIISAEKKYHPEICSVEIKKYDAQKKTWEHTSLDVDKADYDRLSAGDYYKSKNVQTVYFWFDKEESD